MGQDYLFLVINKKLIYYFIKINNKMGAGESTYVKNQEKFVRKNFENVKSQLPKDKYNNFQIKNKLREQYAVNKNGGEYRQKDKWILNNKWKQVNLN